MMICMFVIQEKRVGVSNQRGDFCVYVAGTRRQLLESWSKEQIWGYMSL